MSGLSEEVLFHAAVLIRIKMKVSEKRTEHGMDAEDYFKGKSLYLKLFQQARLAFRRYEKLTGTFKLDGLTDEEIAQLAAFLGVPEFRLRAKTRVRWSRFAEAYEATRFGAQPLIEVMEHVLGVPFATRSELRERKESREDAFRSMVRNDFPALAFLTEIDAAGPLYDWYREDEKEARVGFAAIQKALDHLPRTPTRLPFFSHRITGNPHTFDLSERTGKLFAYVLRVKGDRERSGQRESRTEFYRDLMLSFNLVRDDIMNFAAVNGLIAESDGIEHPMWRAAVDAGVSWNVPLRHLLEVDRVHPAHGTGVFLVENSGVFSTFLDARPRLPLVCSNGQFRLAIWILLEKTAAAGCTFYYSGDFDPEGLLMADQLLQRYGNRVRLWGMDTAHYLASAPAVPLSQQRLLKLKAIRSAQLLPLADQVRSIKRAGYQESIAQLLFDEADRLAEDRPDPG